MNYDSGSLGPLIEQFYEGALTPGGWTEALESTARLMGSAQAVILAFNGPGADPFHIDENYGVPEEVTALYNAHYNRLDPALPHVGGIPIGGWYHDREHVGERAMARSEFYQDFMRPCGYSSIAANRISVPGSFESFLSLQRLTDQPAFTQEDFARIAPALPHIQRALRIRARLLAAGDEATLGRRVLDHLQIPLLVVQADGRVLMINPQADAVLRLKPQVTVSGGFLKLRTPGAAALARLLRDACGVDGPAVAGATRVWTAGHELALELVVTPLPARLEHIHGWGRPLALVMLRDPDQPASPPEAVLQQMYDLTLSEARVAIALATGDTLAETADRLGIALNTVRAHLKSIFAKTGVRRQADLMRELASIVVVSPRPPG